MKFTVVLKTRCRREGIVFAIFLVKTIASTSLAFSCSMSKGMACRSPSTASDRHRVISCMEGRAILVQQLWESGVSAQPACTVTELVTEAGTGCCSPCSQAQQPALHTLDGSKDD